MQRRRRRRLAKLLRRIAATVLIKSCVPVRTHVSVYERVCVFI